MSARHEATFPAFTLSMTVGKTDATEVAPADLARAEFFVGMKVLGEMILGKYEEVTEQDFYGWLADYGEQAAAQLSQGVSESKEGK